jgi:hypothetical protein
MNLLTVANTSGGNRVYVRVRVMAVHATGSTITQGVAWAKINAGGLISPYVSSTTYEHYSSFTWSLSWSSGTLQITPSFSSNYVGMMCEVEWSGHDGRAVVTPSLDPIGT